MSGPPMQSLEEVLFLALSGEDPYNVEELLRKRGEYRPHRDFGVNLSIPWNAGYADDPSFEVGAGSAYTTTRKLESGTDGEETKEIASTPGADDEAYAATLEDLVKRGGDLGRLRRMASADARRSKNYDAESSWAIALVRFSRTAASSSNLSPDPALGTNCKPRPWKHARCAWCS